MDRKAKYHNQIIAYLLDAESRPEDLTEAANSMEGQVALEALEAMFAWQDDPTWLEQLSAVKEGTLTPEMADWAAQEDIMVDYLPELFAHAEQLGQPEPDSQPDLLPTYPTFAELFNKETARKKRMIAPPPMSERSPWPIQPERIGMMALVMLLLCFLCSPLATWFLLPQALYQGEQVITWWQTITEKTITPTAEVTNQPILTMTATPVAEATDLPATITPIQPSATVTMSEPTINPPATAMAGITITPTPKSTNTPIPTASPISTQTPATVQLTSEPTIILSATPTPTVGLTGLPPTATSIVIQPSATPSKPSQPTKTQTPLPTATPSITVEPTKTATATAQPTKTPTTLATLTPTSQPTATPTFQTTPTHQPTNTPTPSTNVTASPTSTKQPFPTHTNTPIILPTATLNPTITPQSTVTPLTTPTASATVGQTATASPSPTSMITPTASATVEPTSTPTQSPIEIISPISQGTVREFSSPRQQQVINGSTIETAYYLVQCDIRRGIIEFDLPTQPAPIQLAELVLVETGQFPETLPFLVELSVYQSADLQISVEDFDRLTTSVATLPRQTVHVVDVTGLVQPNSKIGFRLQLANEPQCSELIARGLTIEAHLRVR